MPGFVDPNEQESRQSLYRDLLSHLNTTIWGSPSTLPYSESGRYTLDMNPVEAFDKSKNPEGAIFAEPQLNWTESVAKVDAVKMLAHGAKVIYSDLLKNIPKNTQFRTNVRDLIRAARNTPQELLTPLKRTDVAAIPERQTAGLYWPRGSASVKDQALSTDVPLVEIDPRKGADSANVWFHEIIHGRHIDAPLYSKRMDEQTGGDVYRRYLELITNKGANIGEGLASSTGKSFYWDNPKELVARDFAESVSKVPSNAQNDMVLMEELYTNALERTTGKMQSKATKLTKRIANEQLLDKRMQRSFPGIDWKSLVKEVGRDRRIVGPSYLDLENKPLSEINPNWMKDKVKSTINKAEELFKKIDTYAAESGPMASMEGPPSTKGPGWQSRTLDWLAGRLGKAPKQATKESWLAKAKQAGLPTEEREIFNRVFSDLGYSPKDRVGAENIAFALEKTGGPSQTLPTQGIEAIELSAERADRYQRALEKIDEARTDLLTGYKSKRRQLHMERYESNHPGSDLYKTLRNKSDDLSEKITEFRPRWTIHNLDEVTSPREILYKAKGSRYKNPDIETHYGDLGEGLQWHQREGKRKFPEGESTHLSEQQSDLASEYAHALERVKKQGKRSLEDTIYDDVPKPTLHENWYKTGFRDLVNRAVKEDSKFVSWDSAAIQKKRWPAGEGTDKFFDTHYDQKLVNFVKKEYGVTPEKVAVGKGKGTNRKVFETEYSSQL